MPRDLPLANGQLLVNFDLDYHLTDIFFPYIGKENQTDGNICRLGVWRSGQFAWLPEGGWRCVRQDYLDDALVTDCCFEHDGLGLRLFISDAVDFHEPVLIRSLRVEDRAGSNDEVRIFFHHDFRLQEVEIGDCAIYDPTAQVVIHFKEDRYVLVGGSDHHGTGIRQYAIGVKAFHNLEGTWRDAEDGVLEGNPVTQGSVDSTVGLTLHPGETAYLWLCLGTSEQDVMRLHQTLLQKTPQELIRRTADYWHAWLHTMRHDLPDDLPESVRQLYLRSLLIARTQVDQHGGILAANDWSITRFNNDTYCYVWPRDAAIIADAFDQAGYQEVARRFFGFCLDTITDDGYFLHKFNPDKTPGSTWHSRIIGGYPHLPIQEDETALVLWALWRYFQRHRNVEEIKPYFRPLIARAGDFLARFCSAETGLPLPSHDLWEERWGIMTFTAAATVAGLEAAAGFAQMFGETALEESYRKAADKMRAAVLTHLYRQEEGRFARMATVDPATGSITGYDLTPDISLLGLIELGLLPAADDRLVRTVDAVTDAVRVRTESGGFARYPGDSYQRVEESEAVPGNPWFICSLWVARSQIARARTKGDLVAALSHLEWCATHALPSGVMAEQTHPRTNEPLSVSPLTWSHAFLIVTVQEWTRRLRTLEAGA